MSNRPNTRSRSATAERSKTINQPSKKALHTRQGAVAPGGGKDGTSSSSGGGGATKWIVIGVAAVVVVALVAAVLIVSSRGGSSGDDLVYGTVQVQGTPLPQAASGGADPAVGQTIPTLTGQAFDASQVKIEPNGKPKVVLFLAHWCPHCQAEVPRIVEELKANGAPTDVEVWAVTTSTDPSRTNFPPAKWLEREGLDVPVLVDSGQKTAASAYGIGGFPYFVVVGADGKVVSRASGELQAGQFESLLDAARGSGAAPSGTAGAASPVS